MLNSRKPFRALALAGLLALGGSSAFAQTCTLFTTNFALRPEGLTELIGDLTVSGCTSPLPANFSILVQLPNGVNFHTTGLPTITPSGGTFGPPTPVTNYAPAGLPNTVSISVTNNVGSTGFTVTGLRINANAASSAGIVSVPALVIISSGATIINLTNNPSLVATILPRSLNFTVVGGSNAGTSPALGPGSFSTCIDTNQIAGFFRFSESFSAVLRRAGPGAPNQEGLNATQGTRLRVLLSGIPANVTVFVPTASFTTGNNILTAISGVGAAVSGVAPGGFTPAAGDSSYTGGYGPASAEVIFGVETIGATSPTSDSTATVDTLFVPFAVRYTGGPGIGTGTATARGGLGTVGGTGIVRFADVTDQSNLFSTNLCATTLLYPYVTTAGGFDTGIAIANTTADPAGFGTPNQVGRCTLTPYGTFTGGGTPPAAGMTADIPAGTVWAAALTDGTIFGGGSRLGTGFSGYLIAQCNFQLAHGYGFIATYGLAGSNAVAQGYLALVLGQNSGTRTPNSPGATIEALNN